MQADFYKYHALGNDMLVIDPASFSLPLTPAAVRLLCHRHFGLGADGICFGPLPDVSLRPTMRFFNPDGSQAEKSGNGLRIFARYVWEQGYASGPRYEIGIGDEVIRVELKDAAARTLTTTMGNVSFWSKSIPVQGPGREVVDEPLSLKGVNYRITAAGIGNPHCVIFRNRISQRQVCIHGPRLETAPLFPNRTNVQLVKVINRHTIQIEIWERGAGYTLASGTSACAAASAAIKTGRCDSPVEVRMAGGAARVSVDGAWQVALTGQVSAVCRGVLAGDLLARLT